MITFSCALSLSTISPSAGPPSRAELDAAVVKAKLQWRVVFPQVVFPTDIRIVAEHLNNCDLRTIPRIAAMEDRWVETTLFFEGADDPSVSRSHTYVIKINSACDWYGPSLSLQNAVTHEVGHILLGYEYHSADKRSIMYYIVRGGGQQILPNDRRRLAAVEAGKPHSPETQPVKPLPAESR